MQQINDFNQSFSCKLVISKLSFPVYLGCRINEKSTKQTVSITIEIDLKSKPKAVTTDKLEDTICYSELAQHIQDFAENKKFNLVEKFSKDIYECVCMFLKVKQHSASFVKITIHKTMSSVSAIKGGVFFTYGEKDNL